VKHRNFRCEARQFLRSKNDKEFDSNGPSMGEKEWEGRESPNLVKTFPPNLDLQNYQGKQGRTGTKGKKKGKVCTESGICRVIDL